ncbi:MAG: phosphonoacetaldehyde hydrolase [Desulfobacterales bacterium]|jgi:phosphonoacetaldehyde hydrolase|nr:phosphonoacetaldehyde hydrolase [Desulfobacterales bacterium]
MTISPPSRSTTRTGPVRAVILDWAGTAVDYGCIGPAAVFVDVFQRFGVAVTMDEARQFMGLMKKDHLRSMCALPRVAARWQAAHGRVASEADIDALYAETEPMMVAAVARHAELIPGLLAFAEALRRKGIRIGSTTGYTRPMMEVLVPEARAKGYRPDAVVCPSDVPAGRPYPWMCYLNAIRLGVHPMSAMVKIGDTLSDVEEGLNAGMWTVGITRTGNLLGLSEPETGRLPPEELASRLRAAEETLRRAGAHYTVEGIWEALPVIEAIEARLAAGERP